MQDYDEQSAIYNAVITIKAFFMKIKCITDKCLFSVIDDDIVFYKNEGVKESKFSVIIGKEYTVYAMTVREKFVWYYVKDDRIEDYPKWKPCVLFNVIDRRISRHWIYDYIGGSVMLTAPIWAYPEWVNDPDYYDRLTDGNEADERIYKQYKEKMDLEFPDNSVLVAAQIGDEEWLICPICIDAWSSTGHIDALVRCPSCKTMMNNPRYNL